MQNRQCARRRRRHDPSHHRSGACIIELSTSNVAVARMPASSASRYSTWPIVLGCTREILNRSSMAFFAALMAAGSLERRPQQSVGHAD